MNGLPALRVRVYRASLSPHLPWVVAVTSPLRVARVEWAVATVLCRSHAYAIAYADALASAAPGMKPLDVALMAKAAADLAVERATEKAGA